MVYTVHYLSNAFSSCKEGKKIINLYLNIIGNFKAYYFNIGREIREINPSGNQSMTIKQEPTGLIDMSERKMIFQDKKFDKEDIGLNVQNIAQLNYFAIWKSVEEREKPLLYDLAQDGLGNYRNLPVIFNLLNRGILIYEESSKLKL